LVAAALEEGYEISHKALVCWAPIPPPAKIPIFRLLFLALEASFTYAFWAVNDVRFGRDMMHICPWDVATLPYDGLCTHSALREGLRGGLDLTAEQHEASAMEQAAIFRQLKAVNATNYHYKQMATNYDEYISAAKERSYKSRMLNPGQHAESAQLLRERNKEEKRYYCEPCDHAAGSRWDYDNHMESKAHDRTVNGFENAEFKCWPCRRHFSHISNFRRHSRTPYHQEKMKQLDPTTPGPSVAQPNVVEPDGVLSAEENDQSFTPAAPAVTQPVTQSDAVQRTVAPSAFEANVQLSPQVMALTARQLSKQSVLPQAKRQATASKASIQSNAVVPAVAPRAVVGPSTPRATESRSPLEPDVVRRAIASSAPPVPQSSDQATLPQSAAPSRPAPAPSAVLASSSNANPFKCEPCGANPKTLAAHNTHIATPKHKRLMAIAEKRKKSNAEAWARHQVWLDERAAAARQLT